MTEDEATLVLATLKAAYPHAFRDTTKKDATAMIRLWARMFAEDSYSEVDAAVGALIATRTDGYSPTIGEVKTKLQDLRAPESLTEQEVWSLVSRACTNGLYGYEKEFAKLPPDVQRVVGRPEQLREWAIMEAETVQSVVASNFMRSFRASQARKKEAAMLPPSVRGLISGLADSLQLKE